MSEVGVLGGVIQEVGVVVGVVVTFDPGLMGEESIEVVVGTDDDDDTGFVVMLGVSHVAMVTLSAAIDGDVDASDCKIFPRPHDFALFRTGVGE